jgi:hypothetical protein
MPTVPKDRRRRSMGWLRALSNPVSTEAIERRAGRALHALVPWLLGALALAGVALVVWAVVPWWSARDTSLVPRHRAEAVCFALAQPPRFEPPMMVQPSTALVRGRFAVTTPAAIALREVMRIDESQVLREQRTRVGDFDVATLWLRLPEQGTWRHWLVVGWMEGSDLAVCNFRFEGSGPRLAYDEILWGDALLTRALRPEHFQAGTLPDVRLRAARGEPLPSFGPRHEG